MYDTKEFQESAILSAPYLHHRARRIGATSSRLTSGVLRTLPPQSISDLGRYGPYVGRDTESGRDFRFCPFVLYGAKGVDRLTNPNVTVMGGIGKGKSSLLKGLFMWEHVFGINIVVFDVKGEWLKFADACGGSVVTVSLDGNIRINPLEAPKGVSNPKEIRAIRNHILRGLIENELRCTLSSGQELAVSLALDEAIASTNDQPEIATVLTKLTKPSEATRAVMIDHELNWANNAEQPITALLNLCTGDYAGLFNGQTTPGLDLDAPVVVFDLDKLHSTGPQGLGLFMSVATARLQNRLIREQVANTIVCYEEGWHVLNSLGTARFMQQSFSLTRRFGMSNFLVIHRPSQLANFSDHETRMLAQGLLADSGTMILYPPENNERLVTANMLNLTPSETSRLEGLGVGQALWKLGTRSTTVQHIYSVEQAGIIFTDDEMRRGSSPESVNA